MDDKAFVVNKDKLEVTTSKVLKATPERIWQACTDPEQIPKWWGPAKYKTVVDKLDLRVGGEWRFVQTDDDGNESAFHGVYKEIDEPNKIVDTFEYEPMPGHVLVETMTLTPQADGTTLLTTTAKYDNLADLEGMVSMGMEGGQRDPRRS
jgi:uncharacterized protein YndB with AHSA1/START domain